MLVSGPDAPQEARSAPARPWRGGALAQGFRDLALANKLLLILMVTSVGALVLAGAAIVARDIRSTRAALVSDLTSLGDVVAGNCTTALSFRDPDVARTVLGSLAARHDIARAVLVLPDGTIFSSYEAPGERPLRVLPRAMTPGPQTIGDRLTIVRPVVVRGDRLGTLYLECTQLAMRARIRDIVASVAGLMLLAALFAYALSLRLHRVVSEPVRRLSDAARKVSESRDYSVRVEWPSRDELGALTESFNGMMAQIQAQEAELVASHELLRQAQKMEAVGQLAGGVAHDFNNLLTAINGYAALLERRTAPDDPRQHNIREIQKAGDRAASLVRQLLVFGRKQTLEPRVIDLRETLADVQDMLRRLIPEHMHLAWETHALVPAVKADPGQVQQAVVNLVVNARDAMPSGGTITIALARAELDVAAAEQVPGATPGRYVVLSVADTGTGIPAEIQAHIFEPFFTTKGVGQGTGLGLATVYGIVQQSGGHVTFRSDPGAGTTFSIFLPEVETAAGGEPGAATSAAVSVVHGGSETILLVEDEPAVCELAHDILRGYGYRVLSCPGPAEAVAVSGSYPGEIHVLLTDYIMPGMNGRELSLELARSRPRMRTVFMSGYTEGTVPGEGLPGGPTAFLQKPFFPETLAATVRAVLDGAWLAHAR